MPLAESSVVADVELLYIFISYLMRCGDLNSLFCHVLALFFPFCGAQRTPSYNFFQKNFTSLQVNIFTPLRSMVSFDLDVKKLIWKLSPFLLLFFLGFHWLSALVNTLVIVPSSEQFCSLSLMYLVILKKSIW